MQQSQWELKAELASYFNRFDEIERQLEILYEANDNFKKLDSQQEYIKRISYLLDDEAKSLNDEANFLVYVISLLENRLLGHNVQYFGKCCCVACKEGIYD